MNAAIDDKKAAEAAHASQIKRMAALLAKDRAPAAAPSTNQASEDTSILPTNPVARELVLACRWLRAQGR